HFTTDGPVRLAPSYVDGRVYFGSDDGCGYCLDAETGALIWQQRIGPRDLRVPGNERLVSLWPVRTSVLVDGGVAYLAAGVFPFEGVFVTALDAETGERRWQTEMTDLPAQGYLLASATKLYVPTGRGEPVVFDRESGKRLYTIPDAGGTFTLLTGETLITSGGSEGRELSAYGDSGRDQLATFAGNQMIIHGGVSYLQADNEMAALDRARYIELSGKRRAAIQQKSELVKKLRDLPADDVGAREQFETTLRRLGDEIEALTKERNTCYRWRSDAHDSLAMILAGETIFAGGDGTVAAYDTKTGIETWRADVDGAAYGLAVAGGRLYVSTDTGAIYCFAPRGDGAASSTAATDASVVEASFDASVDDAAAVRRERRRRTTQANRPKQGATPVVGVSGPFIRFTSPQRAEVNWYTDVPAPTHAEFALHPDVGATKLLGDGVRRTEHEIVIDPVPARVVTALRLALPANAESKNEAENVVQGDDAGDWTDWYRLDTSLGYAPPERHVAESPYADDQAGLAAAARAKRLLDAVKSDRGYALVLGAGDRGRLAFELARRSHLEVVCFDDDEARVRAAREALDATGLYGDCVSVHLADLNQLPVGPYIADIVAVNAPLDGFAPATSFESTYAHLRPAGGLLEVDSSNSAAESSSVAKWIGHHDVSKDETAADGAVWTLRRTALEGAGDWTHQYGSADNAACSQDDLVRGPLSVLWWGRPGSRPMPDRGNRNPAPVSAAGNLFVQGDRTLFGMNAYNGTINWAYQIPTMRRANVPRDGSNMVAAADGLYLALGSECIVFDPGTGERKLRVQIPPAPSATAAEPQLYVWGYLAVAGDLLIGTGVRRGSQYLGDDGEWYEEYNPQEASRVTSRYVFAVDRHTGELRWNHEGGVVINSSITIGSDAADSGTLWLIESRARAALDAPDDRLLDEVQEDQYLVGLDLAIGEQRWEQPVDLSECQYMTYMAYALGRLLVTGTDKEKVFHTYAFDAETGEPIWENHTPTKKTHHSGHLAHPTIVGRKVYFNKYTYDLDDGATLGVDDFNWHGCGVMSASRHTIFQRYEYHGMIDLDTLERTELLGVRSGCWLSLIPTGGILIAPETSAGCSCGHAIQTSMALVPRYVIDPPALGE
ncbi:MAG: PQQ-binding-like beta-propeller repeat protein, partial [Planctomycetales bacterium]|nr:PQQ-binding-like beta-propeller repeat protein [Planctomycetales bacterium]